MRLIDADKLIKDIKQLWDYKTVDDITATTVLKQTITDIKNAPTVNAIPIEWIEEWFSQFYGEQGLEWNRCKRFMLADWEKENEAN